MSLNRCEFIGRLGKDPESRAMPSGGSVVNMSIAVSKQWKDRQTGDRQEKTTWVPVVIFGKLADVCSQYLSKGSQVFIAGEFNVRKWQDKEGNDRYTTEIIANEMTMLDNANGSRTGQNAAADASQSQPVSQPAASNAGPDYGGGDPFLDDIPFAQHLKGTVI